MPKKKILILGSADNWHAQALTRAFDNRDTVPSFCTAAQMLSYLGEKPYVAAGPLQLSEADVILVREVPGGSLEQVIFRMDALHQLENAGVRVINSPYAIEKMVDKYYALSLLQKAGLPVPETCVTEDLTQAMAAFDDLGGDVVIKPLFGSRGVGMVRVTDAETAGRVFKALQLGGSVLYLQQYIPHDNRDLRVLVVGGECVAAMERVADSWKTNIAAGGQARPYDIPPAIQDASLCAAQTLGADYCGVDLLFSADGQIYILEANSMPAWKGLQQVTSFDIADRIAQYCVESIDSYKCR